MLFYKPTPTRIRGLLDSVSRARRLDRPDVDLNLVTLNAQRAGVEDVADNVCHTLAAGAVEALLVVLALDCLPVEARLVQGHLRMWAAPAIRLELAAYRPNHQHALFTGLEKPILPSVTSFL